MIHMTILVAALAAPQEWVKPRLESVLKDLSEFARAVDSGTRTLARAHGREGQPDGMMTEIRGLLETYPDLASVLRTYVRSKEEPVTGRGLAVLALARPPTSETAAILGDLLADPPDLKLAILVCMGYQPRGHREYDSRNWAASLEALVRAGYGPEWKLPGRSHDGIRIERPACAPGSVDLSPMLEGLLALAKSRELGEVRILVLRLAWDFSRRAQATREQRTRVRDLMERTYSEGDTGFDVAIDYFLGRGYREKADLDPLGRGLAKLPIRLQVRLLTEVASRNREDIFKPPFREGLDRAVAALGLPPEESGIDMGTMNYLLVALKKRAVSDPEIAKLIENPTETLSKRLSLAR